MNKEIITNKQGIYMILMFIVGSFIIIGAGGQAKQDIWIVVPISVLMTLPMIFIYSLLLKMYPGKDLFDIIQDTFGKIIGKIIILLMVWYVFHLGARVIRSFSSFVNTVSFPETPQSIITIFIGLLCIWIVKAGIEVMGRWTSFVSPMILIILIITILLSMTEAHLINLKPVLYDGIKPLIPVSFEIFSLPLAETVVFTMIFNSLKTIKKTFSVFLISILAGSLLMIMVSVRNILVLGPALNSYLYFPSYFAVRTLNIGDFLQRFEIVVSLVFIFGGFIKISICLLATAKGFSKLLGFKNHRDLVAPIGLLMMILSCILYDSAMEMFNWAQKIYPYYAIPFQIILPVIILIGATIKKRIKN